MGATLAQLEVFTYEEKGEKSYIDRTLPANADLPINKEINMNSFSLYWNKDDNLKMSYIFDNDNLILERMRNLINWDK